MDDADFRRWLETLARGESFDWDPDSDDLEFRQWIASAYANNGAMPPEWVNQLVHEHRIEQAERALSFIRRTAEAQLGPLVGLAIVTTPPGDLEPTGVVTCGGYGGRITGPNFGWVILGVADGVQEWITRDRNLIWPVCPEHGRGLHAMWDDGVPAWMCKHDLHRVSTIIDFGR